MTPIEIALAKQRLQFATATQREALAQHLAGLQPLFQAADRLHAGARWVRRHPEAAVGGLALVAALRPGARRILWYWAKRAFIVWRFWRAAGRWQERPLARF